MVASKTTSSHTIQPAEIKIHGSKALATSGGSVNIRVTINSIEYEMVSFVRFLSRLEHVRISSSDEWRLATLEAIYDRDYIFPTSPISGQVPEIKVPLDARPSYKYLDYVLSMQGFTIAKDLPGTDDEGKVSTARVLEKANNWLYSN